VAFATMIMNFGIRKGHLGDELWDP